MFCLKAWGAEIPVPLNRTEVTWLAASPCNPGENMTELMEDMFPIRSLTELAGREPARLGRMIAAAVRGINSSGYDLAAARHYLQCIERVEKAGYSLAERYAEEGFAFDGNWVELPWPMTVYYQPETDVFWLSLVSADIYIKETGDGPPEIRWEEC